MDPAALEAGLDPEQLQAVTSTASPIAVLAPAGSGKTRVLTRRVARRIALGEIEPQHVLVVTFTRRAALELRQRLGALGLRDRVTAGTFHALALAQITDHRRDHGHRPPRVLDRKRPVLEEVTGRHDRASLAELATEIEWAKARQVPPAHYVERATEARRRTRAQRATVAEAYRRYEVHTRERGLLDFDDLLLEAAQVIERDERFARAQRWRHRHLFVDEFQDINPLQFRLLEAWRGDRYDLFVVGDPQQAIYTWNGADPRFLHDIERHYPPVQVIRLATNYRSSPQILAGATSVLATAGLDRQPVDATHADGEVPAVRRHDDERAEARAIARALRRGQGPGRPWASQAVLVRTHAQLTPIREALRASRIPHEIRGADPVIDHPAVRSILDDLDRDPRPASTALADLTSLDPAHADADVLDELVARALELTRAEPGVSAGALSAMLRATADRRPRASEDAVTLSTFHAAKGLEWPIVHLAGLEEGFVPISHARTRAARDEEARLLYVAMTRAQRELHLHAARQRTLGDRAAERDVSPLLAHLPTDDGDRDPEHPRSAIELARAAVGSARAPDDLELALHEWRDRVARRARIPSASVMPDRVLRAVAASRPTDLAELGEVDGLGPIKAARFGDELLAVIAGPAPARDLG